MKKTKFMTRLGAVVFALAILVAMAVPALADDITTGTQDSIYNGSQQTGFGVDATDPTHVLITKTIVAFNPDNAEIREPDVQYIYTAERYDTSASAPEGTALNATITDAGDSTANPAVAPKTVTVLNGMDNGVGPATVTFSSLNAKKAARSTGTEFEHTSYFTVDLSKFTHAGVYRYKITETMKVGQTAVTASQLAANYGFEARGDDYSPDRYLDVYIKNDSNAANGLAVEAAIIFKTNASDNDSTNPTLGKDAINTNTEKTTGYEPGVEPSDPTDPSSADYTDDGTVDRYKTYNLQVGKTITGNLADKSHDFPFVITLANANLSSTVTADFVNNNATGLNGVTATTENGVTTYTVAVSSSGNTINASMSNDDYVTLNGLPKGTTVVVKETNDTKDEYTAAWNQNAGTTSNNVTVTKTDATNQPVVSDSGLAMGEGYSVTTSAVNVDGGAGYIKTVLGYTNTISDISPTGLAFRVAPYALMLAAGISLVLLFAKRKREVTDMI